MKKLIIFLVLCFVGWQVYTKYLSHQPMTVLKQQVSNVSQPTPNSQNESSLSSTFKCDGRTYCSQMKSCAEATFFLKNCPNVKMDGNNDGIPCEKQWCK